MPGDPFIDGQFGRGPPRSTGDSLQDVANQVAYQHGKSFHDGSEHMRKMGEMSQQSYPGGSVGGDVNWGAVAFFFLVIGFIACWLFGVPNTSYKQLPTVISGSNFRVRACQFTAANATFSRVLVDNEWVHVQKVSGQTLEVAIYRRPYDGQSIRGIIATACIKS